MERSLITHWQVLEELLERCPFGIYIVDSAFTIIIMKSGIARGRV
jgi:hypothetical protein